MNGESGTPDGSTNANSAKYNLVKYFALSMDLRETSESPLVGVKEGQLAAVVYLSPQTSRTPIKSNDGSSSNTVSESENDGMLIYPKETTAVLLEQGASISEQYHKDFYAKKVNGQKWTFDLNPEINQDTTTSDSKNEIFEKEFVKRSPNRIILVGPGRLFRFQTTPTAESVKDMDDKFDKSIMQCMVILLEEV
jgi:hypothetical protein